MKIISDEFKPELYGPLSISTSPIIYKCADFMSVSVGSVYARKNLNEEDSYLFYMDRSAGVIVKFNGSYVEMDTVYELNKSELEEVLDLVSVAVATRHQEAYNNFIKLYKEMYECIIGEETKMEKENFVINGDLINSFKDNYHISREEFEDLYHSALSYGPELKFEINFGLIDGSVEQIYFGSNLRVTDTTKRYSFAVFSYEDEYADGFLEGFKSVGINKILGIEEFELDNVYVVDYHDLNKIMRRVRDLLVQYYPAKNKDMYQDSMNRLIALFDFTATWTNR